MSRLDLEIHDDVLAVLTRMKDVSEGEIELEIPEGSVIFENSLNLKLLEKKEAEKAGKVLTFKTSDEAGHHMISMLESSGEVSDGFVTKDVNLESMSLAGGGKVRQTKRSSKKLKLPSVAVSMPNFSGLPKIRLSLPKINIKVLVILFLVLVVIGGSAYAAMWRTPDVTVKIVVSSQPLIKSISIKVQDGVSASVEDRVVGGVSIAAEVTGSKSSKTTGEIIIGEKAKGRVIIYNKTASEKEFSKGTPLFFEDDDDIRYELDDGVTVPARVDEDPEVLGDPPVIVLGEAEADVVAVDIGEDFNLDDGKKLEFEDLDTTDFVATVIEEIDGGKSDTVKAVAEEDATMLSAGLYDELSLSAGDSLDDALEKGQKRIAGSELTSILTEEYSAEVGDETEELELTQTISVIALAYSKDDLEKLMKDLLGDFVPDGYELSSEETDINVEVLGNSDNTVLSSTEVDLQVTLKSFVVPELDEDEIKEKLAGKKVSEAEKILGGVRNINTYKLEVGSGFTFLRKLPRNPDDISLEIERE